MLLDQAEVFKSLINNIIKDFNQEIIIKFNGIIASPDGITLLGYVENDSLNSLRSAIRLALQEQGLLSLEEIKYKATTAHVSLLKFTQQINPELLIQFIEKYFDFTIAKIKLEKLVLSISGRYYKTINSDIIQEYKLNAK